MIGSYQYVKFDQQTLLFLQCPFCQHMLYIQGGKKKQYKIHLCFGCNGQVSEP